MLELIVKRGRALVDARSLVIMLREGDELVVQASAGHVEDDARACACRSPSPPPGRSSSAVAPSGSPTSHSRCGSHPSEFGVADAQTALLVPMLYRGDAVGVLAAFDRGEDGSVFSEDDEQLLRTFAASAATAVALAQSVQSDRLRSSLAAADAERRRWARELHDETLQGLGGLRVLLSSALSQRRPATARRARCARPSSTSSARSPTCARSSPSCAPPRSTSSGLRTAIEALLDRHREQQTV